MIHRFEEAVDFFGSVDYIAIKSEPLKFLTILILLGTCLVSQAAYVTVKGKIYFDNNNDSIFNSGDSAYRSTYLVRKINDTLQGHISTDYQGNFIISLPAGDWEIVPENYDSTIYQVSPEILRYSNITANTTRTFDIVISKKIIITGGAIYFGPWNDIAVPSVQAYRLSFTHSGQTLSITGKISLDYNPALTFVAASEPPNVTSAGHIEWIKSNINRNVLDSIFVQFQYPAIADTTMGVHFDYSFKPLLADTIFKGYRDQRITPHLPSPIGVSKGIKWLRTIHNSRYPDSETGRSAVNSIDTAVDGKSIFVSGVRSGRFKYLAKLTSDGLVLWEHYQPDLGNYLRVTSIKHTMDGGVIELSDTLSGSANEYGWSDSSSLGVLIKKYDNDGYLQWKRFIPCIAFPQVSNRSLAILADNNILITFNPATKTILSALDTTGANVVVMKLSPDGKTIWDREFKGNGTDTPVMIAALASGDILISGTTNSTLGDINGFVVRPYNSVDAFVIKLDSTGQLLWSKTFDCADVDFLKGMVETPGGYLFAGYAEVHDWWGRSDSLRNGTTLWLLELQSQGNKVFQRIHPVYKGYSGIHFLADFFSGITSIASSKDGNYYIGGSSADRFGDFKSKHGLEDILLAKINAVGDILWQKAIGGTGSDMAYSFIPDHNDNLIFGGKTSSSDDDIYDNPNVDGGGMLIGKLGITNAISGKVFIDKNGNHIQDAGDPYFSEGKISTYKIGDTTIAGIFNGHYLSNVDTGSYITAYTDSNDYYAVYPTQQATAFDNFDHEATVDFALVPKPGINDLQVSVTATTPARPGFNAGFRIITKNVGTTTIAGAVVKLKKSSALTYLNSTRTTSFITSDTIAFAGINMAAGAADTLDINVKLATPPALNNGDTLILTAIALPQATDTTPANNQATLWEIVRGSYDPNDKTEAHAGIYTPTMKASGEPFQYLIRFQNTGTDTAFYITVKDTLSNQVDGSSLETISASHPYKFRMEGNIATWQFDMIKLVDSATNEKDSHGYISFSIKPKDQIQIGDTVANTAAIYFDFNLPVVTNSADLLMINDQSVVCPGSTTQLQADYSGIAYQWQVNTGNGFANISNGTQYAGVTTGTLLLKIVPSSFYGYAYRCVITMAGNKTVNSSTYKLTFANNWTGATSTAWENAANWSCGTVPDQFTDVIIKANAIRQPEVSSTGATCRSINAASGSHVWVKVGAKLDIKGK